MSLLQNILDQLVHSFDEFILADAFPVHQQHRRHNSSAHYHDSPSHPANYLSTDHLHTLLSHFWTLVVSKFRLDFTDEILGQDWLADLDENSAMVDFELRKGLHNSPKRFS